MSTNRAEIPKLVSTNPPRADIDVNTALDSIDTKMAIDLQGPISARPVPGKVGTLYTATDQNHAVYRDNGTSWVQIYPAGPLSITTTELAAGAVDESKISNGAITSTKISNSLKPVHGATSGTESLRALGTLSREAYPGHLGANLAYRLPSLEAYYTDPNNPVPLAHFGPIPDAIPITGGWTDFGRFIVSTGPSPVRDKTWRTRVTIGGSWFGNGNVGNLTLFIGSNIGSGPWSVSQSFGSGAQNVSASGGYTATGAGRNLWLISMLANQAGGGGGAALYVHDILIEGYVV